MTEVTKETGWSAVKCRLSTKIDLDSFKAPKETYDQVIQRLISFKREHADCGAAPHAQKSPDRAEAGAASPVSGPSRQDSPRNPASEVQGDEHDKGPGVAVTEGPAGDRGTGQSGG